MTFQSPVLPFLKGYQLCNVTWSEKEVNRSFVRSNTPLWLLPVCGGHTHTGSITSTSQLIYVSWTDSFSWTQCYLSPFWGSSRCTRFHQTQFAVHSAVELTLAQSYLPRNTRTTENNALGCLFVVAVFMWTKGSRKMYYSKCKNYIFVCKVVWVLLL